MYQKKNHVKIYKMLSRIHLNHITKSLKKKIVPVVEKISSMNDNSYVIHHLS